MKGGKMLQAMWGAISTILISIFIMAAIFGAPLYFILKRMKTPKIKRYPFRKTTCYPNQFGHLIMVEPNPDMQTKLQAYFRANPEEAKELLRGLNDETW
jgi:hypothetical protein